MTLLKRICQATIVILMRDLIKLSEPWESNLPITIMLPYPPSVNTYWRANGKRRFISKAGMVFLTEVIKRCKVEKMPQFGDARLEVEIIVYPRSKRKFDLDNCLKSILDALQKARVYDDDYQIDRLYVARGEQIKDGGCKVTLSRRG